MRRYVTITFDNRRCFNVIYNQLPRSLLDWCWENQGGNYVRETFGDQQDLMLATRLDLMFVMVGHVSPSVLLAVEFHTRGGSRRAHAHSRGRSDRDIKCDAAPGLG
jgi:hypothetical protein